MHAVGGGLASARGGDPAGARNYSAGRRPEAARASCGACRWSVQSTCHCFFRVLLSAFPRAPPRQTLFESVAIEDNRLDFLRRVFKASDEGKGSVTLSTLASKLLPRLNISPECERSRRAQLRIFGKIVTGSDSTGADGGTKALAPRIRHSASRLVARLRAGLGLTPQGVSVGEQSSLSFFQVVQLFALLDESQELAAVSRQAHLSLQYQHAVSPHAHTHRLCNYAASPRTAAGCSSLG